ncbi:hypothetical protein GQ457_08G023870 [Hibiscus cannabinus]
MPCSRPLSKVAIEGRISPEDLSLNIEFDICFAGIHLEHNEFDPELFTFYINDLTPPPLNEAHPHRKLSDTGDKKLSRIVVGAFGAEGCSNVNHVRAVDGFVVLVEKINLRFKGI